MDTSQLLKDHGLRVTDFRKGVLELFGERSSAVDSRTIEQEMHPADRVTIYRTLRSFEDNGIIHRITDPTGAVKYALCNAHCDQHSHHDSHAHFHCENCHATTCLDSTTVSPSFYNLPVDFTVKEIHVTVSGLCPTCKS